MTQIGWLEELQTLGYKEPLPTPAHEGIQAVIATIEPAEIHHFIQDHDLLALNGPEQDAGPLFILTLGLREFCNIAFLACTEDLSVVLERLGSMAKELTDILEQDDRDLTNVGEKARVIASVLIKHPTNMGNARNSAWSSASAS